MKTISLLLVSAIAMLTPHYLYAQKDPDLSIKTRADNYTIHHVIFNSTFVLPEVAKAYNIKRSKHESLLNVAIIPDGKSGSIAATLSGTVTNLMQQQKTLAFKEIQEDGVTYYLAPVRIGNEEVLRFTLNVSPHSENNSEDKRYEVTFKQTVYADE